MNGAVRCDAMGYPSLAEAWQSRLRSFKRHNPSGLAAQRLENIEKSVANWHQPAFIVFGSFFGQVNLPLVPFEIFPDCPENFTVGANSGQTAYG
jgi:hypothetical protein